MTESATNWHERAARVQPDGRMLINGERTPSAGGETFASIDPGSGRTIAEVASGTTADVDRAVSAAQRAFDGGAWSGVAADQRGHVLQRWADLIDEHGDELALLETLDMGKPIGASTTVDAPGTAATFRWYGELADKLNDEIPATPPGSLATVTREPLGVVGAITPWNFPMEIAAWKLAPALMVGNSVVIKTASESSLSTLRLADLALEAGVPAGVLNVVTGSGRVVGDAIARHPGIEALAFTGSTAVAKRLQIAAGESNMKRLALEAGGKSANLIFADVDDVTAAAESAAFGAFANQGEVCSANSRIYVQRAIFDDFMNALAEAARAYAPGDPLAVESAAGALVNTAHADAIESAVEAARATGEVAFGGDRPRFGDSNAYFTPTAVTGLEPDHALVREELFGPVAVVLPFDDEAEAVSAANDSPYGLAASVWTGSLARAHRVAGQLVAGTVSVNTVDALGLTTPFGGFKQSGFGRDLSAHALNNYSDLKTTWFQFG